MSRLALLLIVVPISKTIQAPLDRSDFLSNALMATAFSPCQGDGHQLVFGQDARHSSAIDLGKLTQDE
jgi:hypothetical protein